MIKKTIYILIIILSCSAVIFAQNSYHVYFNEVSTNDPGVDNEEFIELIGPAGTDLTGFVIVHYNGAPNQDGGLWTHTIGSFTIPDDGDTDNQGNAIGYYVLSDSGVTNSDELLPANIQNGPDGLILYDPNGEIIDAIAWGGAGDLPTDDPGTVTISGLSTANNYLHVTVDDGRDISSLEAPDNVFSDDGSGWVNTGSSPGAINTNQTSGQIGLPVELDYFNAEPNISGVLLSWRTESEIDNLGFIIERKTDNSDWIEIINYQNDTALLGQGTVSYATDYQYTDTNVQHGNTYEYRLADVDYNGVVTYHATREVFIDKKPLPAVADSFTTIAYPNPFNPSTTIRYSVPEGATHNLSVKISIYDITGKLITTLVDKVQSSGWYEIQWNGTNYNGNDVPGGIYLNRIIVGGKAKTNKLILLK